MVDGPAAGGGLGSPAERVLPLHELIADVLRGDGPPTEYEARTMAWAAEVERSLALGEALDEESRGLLTAEAEGLRVRTEEARRAARASLERVWRS